MYRRETFLSHNNPCFRCNLAINIVLVSHTFEIRFHDVIGRSTVTMYSNAKILEPTWPNEYGFDPIFFNLIRWIQLCDKKIWHSLTVMIKFY